MFSITDIYKHSIENGSSDQAIFDSLAEYDDNLQKQLLSLQIDNVPEDVLKSFVLFAVLRGYDIEDFMRLIDAKLVSRFESLYEKLHKH